MHEKSMKGVRHSLDEPTEQFTNIIFHLFLSTRFFILAKYHKFENSPINLHILNASAYNQFVASITFLRILRIRLISKLVIIINICTFDRQSHDRLCCKVVAANSLHLCVPFLHSIHYIISVWMCEHISNHPLKSKLLHNSKSIFTMFLLHC